MLAVQEAAPKVSITMLNGSWYRTRLSCGPWFRMVEVAPHLELKLQRTCALSLCSSKLIAQWTKLSLRLYEASIRHDRMPADTCKGL